MGVAKETGQLISGIELSRTNGEINVGERLRAIRNLRRRTLKQVAASAGLSEGFLRKSVV